MEWQTVRNKPRPTWTPLILRHLYKDACFTVHFNPVACRDDVVGVFLRIAEHRNVGQNSAFNKVCVEIPGVDDGRRFLPTLCQETKHHAATG